MKHRLRIRPANINDACGIAEVNIQSWKETYPGIMPETRMANLDVDRCTVNWQQCLSEDHITYVAEVNGKIIGYISGGKNREFTGCETGLANLCDCELAAMYILNSYHKHGIGRKLFKVFAQQMIKSKYKNMAVWVAKLNPAVDFYTKMGGERIDARDLLVTGELVPLIAFKYELAKLKLFSLETLTAEALKEYYDR